MKISKPKNSNYCANVVTIKNIIPIENCDNVVHTNIGGNMVIVSKDTKVGDKGLYFPAETQLSEEFLSNNNLYRHTYKNIDDKKKGFFEDNGRVKTMKFRGNMSQGFFIPINSLENMFDRKIDLDEGDEFDELFTKEICRKYIIKKKKKNIGISGKKSKKILESRIIDNQFRFHKDTEQLWKNIWKIKADDWIHISYKIHGTSSISSKILCKKKNPFIKLLKSMKFPVIDSYYDNIYASRKVIKNGYFLKDNNHYYKKDIWKEANKKLSEYLSNGMTIYYEIAGYINEDSMIQDEYDYGCNPSEFETYIYRITYTSVDGNVFEFSSRQVQEWCKMNALKAIPEMYYGKVKDLDNSLKKDKHFQENLIEILKDRYLGGKCHMCKNKVPAEGIVLRIDKPFFDAYKLKSFEFYERETKELNKNKINIEDDCDKI